MVRKKSLSSDRKILHQMLSIPTAPFAEHLVIAYVERFCARRKAIKLSRDKVGNVLVHIRQGRRSIKRPVCITAHLDHPGFVADRMIGKRRLRAFWRGGVPPEYFVGSRVRFWTGDRWVKSTVRSIKTVTKSGRRRVETANLEVGQNVPSTSIGMWDLPDPVVRGDRIHARGCDDIAGAAAMLCCLDRLAGKRISCDAYFLFTRAEEVGFVGAIAAAKGGTIPKKCFIVAMETSSQLPDAKMGDGPILRVGDRSSAFTPSVTAHCHAIARDLAATDRRFIYQRKLMDGGTCESSAYCQLGHEATGLCVALGNYHNLDLRRKKIGSEYIDLNDFDNVVKWFVELARSARSYTGRDDTLKKQLAELERSYRTLLRTSMNRPL